MITISQEDNMQLMSRYPDGYFDLAIVDPPYGILNKTPRGGDHKFNKSEYGQWDIKPSNEYFKELFRVSKNQIIWEETILDNCGQEVSIIKDLLFGIKINQNH